MNKVSDDFVVIGNTGGYYDEDGKFIVCEEYETFPDEVPDHADAITSCYCDMDEDEIDLEDVFRNLLGDGDIDDVIYVGDFDVPE